MNGVVRRYREADAAMCRGEEGFMLVGLIVAIFLVLLALSVAAPKVAQDLRREREVEAVHRGNQYIRAIRLYYRKTHTFPGSIEQLEKTNNIRFLRQQYVDPMTGKADWKLIHVGEAKTTVKGFFGQPLAGLTTGLGSAAGMASPGIGQPGAGSGPGSSSYSSGSSFGFSSSGSGGGLGGASAPPVLGGPANAGTNGPSAPGGSSSSSGASSTSGPGSNSTLGSAAGIASQSPTGTPSGGAPFVGVGLPKDGDSITVLNEQTTYDTWEFIYDPRIEQLYAKGALFGGSSNLGSASGNSSGFGNTPGSGSAPGFGNTPGTGFGSQPGTSPPTTPTTPPQQPQ
jgi:type II secretory pathway pseudopilin PulG